MNLPIMSMNAAVQAICPPPKYRVTDLVNCEIGDRARLEHLFLIERGAETEVGDLTLDAAVDALMLNTEDAYGFPPYASLAPHLRLGPGQEDGLAEREREILLRGLSGASVTRIVARDYGWATLIEQSLGLDRDEPSATDRAAAMP
jgi:hypothetical protein